MLTAGGLLILCCALIIGLSHDDRGNGATTAADATTGPLVDKQVESPAESPGDVASNRIQPSPSIPDQSRLPIRKNPTAKPNAEPKTVKRDATNDPARVIPESHVAKNPDHSADDSLPTSGNASDAEPGSRPKGIQLAETVKLPAVILAINAAENDTQSRIPPPVAAAMRGIVDTFYQDLADSAEKVRTDTAPEASGAESGAEDTIVIHPGPAVDRARERANETYRSLFGDSAFDQMTMKALMEAQLPAGPVTGGN